MLPDFDAVLIGRNEGARLARAIKAAQARARKIVYVDSMSSDGSVAIARTLGVAVVELDDSVPLSAGRGRNAGFAALGDAPAEFVQFIDGDCILDATWPDVAREFLVRTPAAGLVHGNNHEESPHASIYNWLTDWEWHKTPGPESLGLGVFMCRSSVFAQIGGFRESMIAAEDDELFFRFRSAGWETWCINEDMSAHDAQLLRFGKWFRRMVRAGHSFAELGHLHPGAALASRIRAVVWAGILPVVAVLGAVVWPPAVALVLALYLLSIARQTRIMHAMGLDPVRAGQAALLLSASKFANLHGMLTFWWRRFRRSDATIIEYK